MYSQWVYPYVPHRYYHPVIPTTNENYLEAYRYNEDLFSYVPHEEEEVRPTRDVDRVMKILKRQYQSIYKDAQRGGMDSKLTEYLFRSIVRFVDDNYSSYSGSINERVEKAAQQLKKCEPWIFELFNLYRVSPASQVRITNTILTVSFENLRRGNEVSNPR
ncbi:hypothetical protein ACLHDF_16695 [Priestia aryabhattai]|uniref:hypothetical protein n=1 Tax=Priestia megaterium TaxID=1404 RepID=UPI0039B94130